MSELTQLDLHKKYMGRSPLVSRLIWGETKKNPDGAFCITSFDPDNRFKVTFGSELEGKFDPYSFYAIRSKRNSNSTRWIVMAIDNDVLYSTNYHDIMPDQEDTFKSLYDKTLTKEMTAFEVLSYFGL